MNRLVLSLRSDEHDALMELAARERRDPRDRAALMIRRELERVGLLLSLRSDAMSGMPNNGQDAKSASFVTDRK